jgi:hypothetical protein
MIAIILLTVFGGLFAAMALAPLVIEESGRAEADRRRAVRPTPTPMPTPHGVVNDRNPVAA